MSHPTVWRKPLNKAYVNGAWRASSASATFDVLDPCTNTVLADVPDLTADDVRAAIGAAHRTFDDWKATPAKHRSQALRRWHDLVVRHKQDLATVIVLEQGKPLAEARAEVDYGASFIDWFAEEAKRTYGRLIPPAAPNARLSVRKEPIGVCGLITPWNFPLAMITRKAAPALAAGCTVVAKPSEETPLSALALADLADAAGIPPGVFNVVTAAQGKTVGDEFCRNPTVRKISFTGSTAVGKSLMKTSSDTVKRLSLELGGNAPFIVFADADMDAAVAGAMSAKFRNTGQTCVCANRFYVEKTVADQFSKALADSVSQLNVGSGLSAKNTQGPLINGQAVRKVQSHIDDAVQRGAQVLAGAFGARAFGARVSGARVSGARVSGARASEARADSLFVTPTVLSDVAPDALITKEETFGPVAGIVPFHDEQEAIKLANATSAGLAAYVYSTCKDRIERLTGALEFGMIGVNTGLISNEMSPFGGVKESGLGREGGREGIEEYLETKYVCELFSA